MIDRQHGAIIFECDGCGAVLETEKSDFNEAMSAMREAEWKPEKAGAGWEHYCPGCQK